MKAYPYIHKHPTTGNTKLEEGMDLRDYFAGLAMQGLIASPRLPLPAAHGASDVTDVMVADLSYKMADAMMKAREVKNEHS
jgi:hypothetical protein